MLYGRGPERAYLAALVEQARAGTSAVLVVTGEPGVGKTALLRDLTTSEPAGQNGKVRVLRTAGVESESPLSAGSAFATGVLPGLLIIGVGVGMVFAPVSITAMAGIPPQDAGMASGFLMTGHEVGAALGVAFLSAVASTAGSLTNATGVVAGFDRGFLAAAGIAALLAIFAYLRMPATRIEGGAGMHMHH